jgi:hypothetical protein
MEPRKRIQPKSGILLPVEDEQVFTKNKCSDKARKVLSDTENIEIELWFDQHYFSRLQFGDENGKRKGIEKPVVEKLVLKSMKYLIFFSGCVNKFTFVNHNPGNARAIRTVLKTQSKEGILNVAIECHLLELNKYEITVKTAMCEDNFAISDGQYYVEIDVVSATLYQWVKGKEVEIYSI